MIFNKNNLLIYLPSTPILSNLKQFKKLMSTRRNAIKKITSAKIIGAGVGVGFWL
jgi:hypothetical protein